MRGWRSALSIARAGALLNAAGPVLLVAFAGMLFWYLLSATYYADRPWLLPGPGAVASAALENFTVIAQATFTTFVEAMTGFASAAVIGVLTAAVMSQSRFLEKSIYPYAVLLQTVPIITVAPLIVLWFGYGQTSVIVISIIISLFPIINNTLLGLRSTPKVLVELFDMQTQSRAVTFFKLRLPSAMPQLIAGMKISAGLSVIGAIVGEFLIGTGGGRGGLGVQIIFAQGQMHTALLFAEIFAATLLGFLFFSVVSAIGNLVLRGWHESAA